MASTTGGLAGLYPVEKKSKKEKKEKKPKFSFNITNFKEYPRIELYTYIMNVKTMKESTINLYEADLIKQCEILDALKQSQPETYAKTDRVLWLDFSKVLIGDPKLSKKSVEIMSAIEPKGHFKINIILASFMGKTVLNSIFDNFPPKVPTVLKDTNKQASEILLSILTTSLYPEKLCPSFYLSLCDK